MRYEEFHSLPWAERHTLENQKLWGVWRWRGMLEHRQTIVAIIRSDRTVIDFGGAEAPLCSGPDFDRPCYRSVIVDSAETDINGNPVLFHTLDELYNQYDVFFSSHTLEHVDSLPDTFSQIKRILRPRGWIILHLPSDKNAEHWHPAAKEGHKRLFALQDYSDRAIVRIDKFLMHDFDLNICEYCGDSSIMIIGRKL